IVTVAGMINALRIIGKELSDIKVVLNGAGAAGMAIVQLLYSYGVRDMIMCDSKGAIYEGRSYGMNDTKAFVAKWTNRDKVEGSLMNAKKVVNDLLGFLEANLLKKELLN